MDAQLSSPNAPAPRKRRRYNVKPREPRVSVTFDLPARLAVRLREVSGESRGARSAAIREAVAAWIEGRAGTAS